MQKTTSTAAQVNRNSLEQSSRICLKRYCLGRYKENWYDSAKERRFEKEQGRI